MEGGNVDNVGAMGKDKEDPPIRTVHSNQPREVVPLIAKTTQELMARKLRKMITEAGGRHRTKGEGEIDQGWRQGIKAKEEEAGIYFFVNIRALREGKEAGIMLSATRGAASPWFTGAGSDLLVVKLA